MKMKPAIPQWTIEEALKLIRYLQPILHQQCWHVALGGGVLNKGYSDKDLDLYFFPFGSKDGVSVTALDRWLELMWGTPTQMSVYRDFKDEAFMRKEKFFLEDGKRIDVFIGAKKQPIWKKLVEKFWLWKYGEHRFISTVASDAESVEIT